MAFKSIKENKHWIFAIGLPIFSALGAYTGFLLTPYIVLAFIILFIILGAFKKIDKPLFYLFGLSLALLWGTSMLGSYIVGIDIHSEIYVSKSALNGWDIAIRDSGNTSFVLGFVAPLLSKIGFPLVWQFKLLYPFMFSFTPLFIYSAYTKFMPSRYVFLGCIFIMIMPMFTMESTSHVKGAVSQFFLVALLPLIFCSIKLYFRIPLIIICILGVVVNHYSTGIMAVIYFIALFGGILIAYLFKRYRAELKNKVIYITLAVLVVGGAYLSYYSIAADGSVIKTLFGVGEHLVEVNTETEIVNPTTTTPTKTELQVAYEKRTKPTSSLADKIYLFSQEPTVRTAIGLDFFEVDWKGKIFRILQLLTELMIIIGVITALKSRIPIIYKILVIDSFISLLICIFVPYVSTVTSATRFYNFALYFLAPVFVMGLVAILRRPALIAGFLVAYTLFTTGFILEATQETDIAKFNIPYSLAFSNERLNIAGEFTESDIDMAEWFTEYYEHNKQLSIYSDYNGYLLMFGFYPKVLPQQGIPKGHHYLIVPSWEFKNDLMVRGYAPAGREYRELVIPDNAEILYKYGSTRVYEVYD